MRAQAGILLFLASFVLAGCGSGPQRLMRTPSVVEMGIVDPTAAVAESRRSGESVVFIASGRVPARDGVKGEPLTTERGHVLHLGVAGVQLGEGLSWDELAAATVGGKHTGKPVVRMRGYEAVGVLWETVPPADLAPVPDGVHEDASREAADRWFARLNEEIAATGTRDLVIYVHGFNTDFAVNTGMAAEIWHYAGRRGAVLSFAWPSRHRLLGYGADKANAAYAVRHLRILLEVLAERSVAARIHFVAHSAGCPIVVDALHELRLLHGGLSRAELGARFRIGRVVLAAPDMDLMQFFNASLDGFDDLPERIAIYASREDGALRLASLLFEADRLGRSVGHLTAWEREVVLGFDHIEAVDVSNPEDLLGDFLGHGYYHRDPWVSSDILLFLADGLRAAERGLVRNLETGFWEFPEGYLDGLRALEAPAAGPVE
jgi:esterase/lipase superfamily enzyme